MLTVKDSELLAIAAIVAGVAAMGVWRLLA
jgi:hypothetical protein